MSSSPKPNMQSYYAINDHPATPISELTANDKEKHVTASQITMMLSGLSAQELIERTRVKRREAAVSKLTGGVATPIVRRRRLNRLANIPKDPSPTSFMADSLVCLPDQLSILDNVDQQQPFLARRMLMFLRKQYCKLLRKLSGKSSKKSHPKTADLSSTNKDKTIDTCMKMSDVDMDDDEDEEAETNK